MEFDFQAFLNRKKLKQREASELLGVSMGLIGSWAVGRAKPSYDTIIKLIDAGITIEELFGKEYASKISKNSNLPAVEPPTNSDLKAAIKEVMAEMVAESTVPKP